jgi:non-specific serine/threonine protein kinase
VEVLDANFSFAVNKQGDEYRLKGEVVFKNKVFDIEHWMQMLGGKTEIENQKKIQIFSDKTKLVWDYVYDLYGSAKTKKKDSKVIIIPRLQILDWIYLRNLGVKFDLNKEDEQIIKRLTNFESIKPKVLPKGFRGHLRKYQKEGYDWLAFLYENKFGACLADDMGLGKTIQAIVFLGAVKENVLKRRIIKNPLFLIVVPASILFNWQNEFQKFYAGMRVYQYFGIERQTAFKNIDVVLTTYDILRRDIDKFKDKKFQIIIFDEVQLIKNIASDRASAARQLKAEFRLCLTGTPLQNNLLDYFSTMDIAIPGIFGTYSSFKERVKRDEKKWIVKRSKPFILRRSKEAICQELPTKTENTIYLNFSELQKGLYLRILSEVKGIIDDAFSKYTKAKANLVALTAILRLRQICLSPKIIDQSFEEDAPKIIYLFEKLKELKKEGHSALVFSQFRSLLLIIKAKMKQEKMSYYYMDGQTPVKHRKKVVEQFQESTQAAIFLISLKTGGLGLNLTKASYVFHLDPWWNPAVERQASDRAHRIGQKQKVFVNRIVMHPSIEERMLELNKRKRALFVEVLDSGLVSRQNSLLSKEDFDFLISDI